jgi:hypothetical protein
MGELSCYSFVLTHQDWLKSCRFIIKEPKISKLDFFNAHRCHKFCHKFSMPEAKSIAKKDKHLVLCNHGRKNYFLLSEVEHSMNTSIYPSSGRFGGKCKLVNYEICRIVARLLRLIGKQESSAMWFCFVCYPRPNNIRPGRPTCTISWLFVCRPIDVPVQLFTANPILWNRPRSHTLSIMLFIHIAC